MYTVAEFHSVPGVSKYTCTGRYVSIRTVTKGHFEVKSQSQKKLLSYQILIRSTPSSEKRFYSNQPPVTSTTASILIYSALQNFRTIWLSKLTNFSLDCMNSFLMFLINLHLETLRGYCDHFWRFGKTFVGF